MAERQRLWQEALEEVQQIQIRQNRARAEILDDVPMQFKKKPPQLYGQAPLVGAGPSSWAWDQEEAPASVQEEEEDWMDQPTDDPFVDQPTDFPWGRPPAEEYENYENYEKHEWHEQVFGGESLGESLGEGLGEGLGESLDEGLGECLGEGLGEGLGSFGKKELSIFICFL